MNAPSFVTHAESLSTVLGKRSMDAELALLPAGHAPPFKLANQP